MKNGLYICKVALISTLLSGCVASHPLPEDATNGVNTVAIVKKIRCEAADALFEEVIARLKSRDPAFAAELLEKPEIILQKASRGRVTPAAYAYLDKYNKGEIGYEFNIDIEGTANRGAGMKLIDVFNGSGERQFDIGGGIEQKSQSKRQFQISDKFITLLALRVNRDSTCSKLATTAPLYPITGRIGLDETISTFLDLNDLAALSLNPDVKDAQVTRFLDELVFTTTVEGRLNPKITLAPSVTGATASEIGLTNSQKRTDKHSVIVSIAVPVAEIKGVVPSQVLKNIDDQQTINGLRTLTNDVLRRSQ